MAVRNIFILAVFGLLHTVTCQTGSSIPAPGASGFRADVTTTVMALHNETGYTGKPTDANVQEIVAMLINGTVPTDADLLRLGIIPQRPTFQMSTPPPYVIPGSPAGLDPSITLATIGQQNGQPGSSSTSGSSLLNPPGVSLTGTQLGAQTGTGPGSTDPFASATAGNSLAFGNLGSAVAAPETTPRPLLGDPFSMSAMSGTGGTLQNLATLDLNALGPKPFASLDPLGGLGTPGSPTDFLGSMGPGGLGAGVPAQTGIMDTSMQQPSQHRSPMSNPMPMMMMMNPELMEGMMAENPMMAYMMMQQFNRPRPRPQPALTALPSMPMDMAGMGGFGGGVGGAPGGMMSPMGGGTGGMMDLMGSAPGGSMAASGMGTFGGQGQGLSGLDGLGAGASMGLNQGSLAAGRASPGLTDINSLLNMGNPGMAGPSAAPVMDPMFASVG